MTEENQRGHQSARQFKKLQYLIENLLDLFTANWKVEMMEKCCKIQRNQAKIGKNMWEI